MTAISTDLFDINEEWVLRRLVRQHH